nr:flagellar filament capping protein FliD [Massilia terrae]
MNVKDLVSNLMATEQGPMNTILKQEATDQAKLSAFGTLKGALGTLQTAASTLNMSSTFASVAANVADSSYFTASTSGTAVAGDYNIQVKALAASQKLMSSGFSDPTTVVGDGTLTIDIGKYDTATPPGFTAKSGSTAVTITIGPDNHTLAGIRDAINGANAGISASIVNDGTTSRLSITTKDSGTANQVRIGVATSGGSGLSALAYNGGAATGLTQNVAAADAHLVVDGLDIYKSSNTVTDAVQGITLNLLKTTPDATPDKLSLTPDTNKIRSAIDSFVSAYNAVHAQIGQLTAYDASTGTASLLTGDSTTTGIDAKLRSMVTSTVATGIPGLTSLTDIGVGFQLDGTLKVDTDKRDRVLNDPTIDVKKLFVKSSDTMVGVGSIMNTGVSAMIFGNNATINQKVDNLNADFKQLEKRKTDETARLQQVQDRYTLQYSSLDTLIASMNKTQSYLTQQLAALKANSA